MDISKVRKDFPVLETQAYLNSAATGPLLSHVKEAVIGWWDAREDLQYVDLPNAKGEVANLIHCDEESVALVHRAPRALTSSRG